MPLDAPVAEEWRIPRLHHERCEECGCPMSAQTLGSLQAAFDDHADYVNTHADKEHDAHFEEHRMNRLMKEHPRSLLRRR